MSFIKADDVWMLWTILIGWAAISIYLEQHYKWASALSGCVIALIGAMVLANLKIIPLDSPVYDNVWSYVVPMAVPLLLFDADVRKIWKESGRSFGAFHIAALGTFVGTFVAAFVFGLKLPQANALAAMYSGTYIGGSVNFAAMAEAFKAESSLVSAGVVADNFIMAIYFFVLMTIPNLLFFKKVFKHPLEDQIAQGLSAGENKAARYWGRKEISLLDIAKSMAIAIAIVTVSTKLAGLIGGSNLPGFIRMFFGQKYLIITTVAVVCATVFSKSFSNIKGAQEIGTFFIYIFFVVIGAPASLGMILQKSPLLFVFAAIILIFNLLISLLLGKLFKFDIEEIMIACNATSGGPTTAAAMAIAKGWNSLVLPALLTGVWGYVIGNYVGLFIGNVVGRMFGL